MVTHPLEPLSAEEQSVANSAQAFLAKEKTDWGKPSKVEPMPLQQGNGNQEGKIYCVYYRTPPDEMKLLGDRSVLVNIKTGHVEFRPRD